MKTPVLIASLLISLFLFGCSREGGKAGLVPRKAAEVAASPDFNLEYTTPSGVKCYVREITREVANTIAADSRDSHFFRRHKQSYLEVFVCNDRIVDLQAGDQSLSAQQFGDTMAWGVKRAMAADGADKEQEAAAKRRALFFH